MVDWEKPLQTKSGHKVRVLSTTRSKQESACVFCAVVGTSGADQWFSNWHQDGRLGISYSGDDLDIINVPESPPSVSRDEREKCHNMLIGTQHKLIDALSEIGHLRCRLFELGHPAYMDEIRKRSGLK